MLSKKDLFERVQNAKSEKEVQEIFDQQGEECANLDAKLIFDEVQHRLQRNEKLDLDELDAVSGGTRDWWTDGCAATCEEDSWCWSNDKCYAFEVQYLEFHQKCTNGQRHDWELISRSTAHGSGSGMWVLVYKCRRCGESATFNEFLPDVPW